MMNHQLADSYRCWPDLVAQHKHWQKTQLNDVFLHDPQRVEKYSLHIGQLFLDYSKNHINAETLRCLLAVAEEAGLPKAIEQLLSGSPVNNTENRPALHTALRSNSVDDNGLPKTPQEQLVAQTQAKMSDFVNAIHSGQWLGTSGKPIKDIVNIGIGGSDLGPRMVTEALSAYHKKNITLHFVANIDGADICSTLEKLEAGTTLFIIASKSFSTLETTENASSARNWLIENGCPENQLHRHLVAISTNTDAALSMGISAENIFPMWDWVGGRYSLWSAIGLPIALAIGMDNFHQLCTGASIMDEHFSHAPMEANMPVLLALLTFWYNHFWDAGSQAVLPYAEKLKSLPLYLQQLDMESLGKSVNRDGGTVDYQTGLILWGTQGSNGQHSFHQLLHQGTRQVPVDFILVKTSMSGLTTQHTRLLASGISQSQALLTGKNQEQARQELVRNGTADAEALRLAPHKTIPGNRASNTLVLEALTPEALGSLIALYEHKVYCLSVLWKINAFDQWGVELGKQLGNEIFNALKSGNCPDTWDSSTRNLVHFLRTSDSS